MRMNDKTKYAAIYKLLFPSLINRVVLIAHTGRMLDARTIPGGSEHIRRMCPFMGYNNNMAPVLPVYCPDIYGKFISFYAATHSRESGDVLALIVGNFVCIKY